MTQIIKILRTIIVAIYLPASLYAEVPYSTSNNGKTMTRINVSPSEELYCMHFDRQGLLWLGTSSGIRLYDGYATHELFGNEERRFPQLGCDVRSITSDGDSNLWAGTNDGLIRLQMGTGLHRLYRFPQKSQKIIYKLFTANDGTVYVGTDDGFSVYDKKNDTFEHFNTDNTQALFPNGRNGRYTG